jgi:hypothetical protein
MRTTEEQRRWRDLTSLGRQFRDRRARRARHRREVNFVGPEAVFVRDAILRPRVLGPQRRME